jgi:hypothetical protein
MHGPMVHRTIGNDYFLASHECQWLVNVADCSEVHQTGSVTIRNGRRQSRSQRSYLCSQSDGALDQSSAPAEVEFQQAFRRKEQ